jgi:Sortase domain
LTDPRSARTPGTRPAGRGRRGWVHALLASGLLSLVTVAVLSLSLVFPQPRLVAIVSSTGSAGAPALAPVNLAGPVPTALELPVDGGISASIDSVDVSPDGDLGVPEDPNRLGWWDGSAAPAAGTGTVVIDGHVDSQRYGDGFFVNLRRLQPGDVVTLTDAAGTRTAWAVTEVGEYPSAELADSGVFAQQATPRLALITCGGAFDRAAHHYLNNLVVYATPAVGVSVE